MQSATTIKIALIQVGNAIGERSGEMPIDVVVVGQPELVRQSISEMALITSRLSAILRLRLSPFRE